MEKFELQEVVVKMLNAMDWKDWDVVLNTLSEDVYADYSSLDGSVPGSIKSKDLVDKWIEISGDDDLRIHHMASNMEVDIEGDFAEFKFSGYITHFHKKVSNWDILCKYIYKLEKIDGLWKIFSIKLDLFGTKGNLNFFNDIKNIS